MVLGRNDKRKRKEGDLVDLMDPASAAPKRAKVHAQRKFAQGVATIFSPVAPLIKEKERPKPALVTELITHKRPNTEDFLTFLCFRGTSILPPSLNFFNQSKKEKSETKAPRRGHRTPPPSNAPSKCEREDPKAPALSKPAPGVPVPSTTKKKFPNVIHKAVAVNKFKTATSTVQALKKKYKEQRLAKQRIEIKLKTSVMRTRSAATRTLLKSPTKLSSNPFLKHLEKKSLCLRSSGAVERLTKASKLSPKAKKKPLKKKLEEKSESSGDSEDQSEDQSIPKRAMKSRTPAGKQTPKDVAKTKNPGKTNSDAARRVTRSHREPVQSHQNQRPSRKTKEAAAVYMEILSRKLVSPDLDNDDNMSLESFPEVPNARRDSAVKKALNDKRKSPQVAKKSHDDDKTRPISAKKRNAKGSKFSDSDDNDSVQSEKSNQASVKTRAITRRSTSVVKSSSAIRNLRSAAKSPDQKFEKSTKSAPKAVSVLKEKRKVKPKRKSDDEKSNADEKPRTKKLLKKPEHEGESDEEPLGAVLNRINKTSKPSKLQTKRSPAKSSDVTKKFPPEPVIMIKKMSKISITPKGSDDEGSFRGFSKKSVKNVSSPCSLKMNNDAPKPGKTDEIDEKLEGLKDCDKGSAQTAPIIQDKVKSDPEKPSGPPPLENNVILPQKELPQFPIKKTSTPVPPKAPEKNFLDVPTLQSMGRKERVNMSTEQIEKWLNESSMVKEESKAEMETVINFSYGIEPEKPKLIIPTVPKIPNPPNPCHLSIPTRIQHLVRPVNVAIAKIAEKQLTSTEQSLKNHNILKPDSIILSSTGIATAKTPSIPTNRNKINADIKEIIKGRTVKTLDSPEKTSHQVPEPDESDINSLKVISDNETVTTPSPNDKKKNQSLGRKPFVSKVKERKLSVPNSNAFSPEDESSVYAFKNETETPVNTPFRRKIRENRSETSIHEPKKPSETDKFNQKPIVTSKSPDKPLGLNHQLNSPSETSVFKNIPSIWNNDSCSTSIAVQINFNDSPDSQGLSNPFYHLQSRQNAQKNPENTSNEISTQTENSNSNEDESNTTQVFYIPLENVGRNISQFTTLQGQPLIQGVAVKLGTEGPNGPNQRVLLRAQLVTKPPLTVTRCPPIGTVQPTTRAPQGSMDPVPSTSTSIAPPSPVKVDKKLSATKSATTADLETPEKMKKPTAKAAPREAKKKSTDSLKKPENQKRQEKRTKKTSTSNETESLSSTQSGSLGASITSDRSEARLADAPTFHPTEKDFQDPLEYIEKIRPLAEKYGICKVVPPSNFKPECKVSDDMRFTAYNQYVHRMLHRWGPNVKEMMAIKKYLATQSITLSQPPWIGGMEVDLPHLYQTVQSLGGLKEVIEKKKWQKVADGMKIPKSAQDRVTKLDDIYCKYLLPYDTLSTEEREKLFEDVETEWRKRETKALERLNDSTTSLSSMDTSNNEEEEDEDSSDDTEECIVKGRNMPLNAFYRIARNTQRMWFGESNTRNQGNESEASSGDVESAFWRHVSERKRHVCVHAASIDSSGRGFGFSVAKNSPFARHPWNLKVLTNNSGSVLRALGPLMGVTIPTIHVGMLFSACCWYRDPHGLPWIEYLHTGAKKIWYGIPNELNDNFREALSKMVPRFCKNKKIWLPSDTAMVPPEMLVSNGVPLCRTVQEPGQFIIVFPKAFTSSICTGYVVSESVYFAQTTWLGNAEEIFKDLQDSCEPSMFSFERLMFSIINDSRSHIDILKQILPVMMKIREKELHYRQQLEYYGLSKKEKLPLPDNGKRKKAAKVKEDDGDFECETCRMNLFVSLMNNSLDDSTYCLPHALQLIAHKKQVLKHCTLKYTYSEDELDDLIHKLEDRIEAKSKKKSSKQSD
ncbi:protein Jumonji [Diachasma alloeum]|uniref:protein Jumonji n=1 Tax=Diachasma alloeum TaxID=454923 RepID=UPI0007383E20|nr:protein Jumonji [Diachasma alloeum]